jgi:hypothetical protein
MVRECALPLLLIAAVAFAWPAAAEMPNYDVGGHCKKVAAFGGTSSQMILNACYRQEQSAYNGLKPTWDQLPAMIRAHCDQVAKFGGGGSFMILQACIEQERTAAHANDDFQFQR